MINYDVVIVDSGVNLNNYNHISGICIKKTNESFITCNELEDEVGHGTIMYSMISKYIDPARIYIVKLSSYQNELDDSCIIAALKYIKEHINCKIINMSLGVKTGDNISELYQICADISKTGTVVVSAFDNEGCYSFPAAFDCVIGVDNKNDFRCTSDFGFVENSPINILAKGSVQRLAMPNGKTLLVSGSSIACAHISSILAREITEDFNFDNAIAFLKSKSKYIFPYKVFEKNIENNLFKITNAAVFPFAKEAHAFVRFSDMLTFNILNYYDVRYSGKVGRKISSYFEEFKSGESIMDIEHIDFTNIDTIILGHLDELNSILGRDFKMELIKKAIIEKVNIFSFDPLNMYIDLLNESEIKYYYPEVLRYDVPQNTFGKMYKISKPVVGIFGTSSQQGKILIATVIKKGTTNIWV